MKKLKDFYPINLKLNPNIQKTFHPSYNYRKTRNSSQFPKKILYPKSLKIVNSKCPKIPKELIL